MTQTPWRVLGGPLGAHTSDHVRSPAGWSRLAVLLVALPVLAALAVRGWCLSNGFVGQAPLWRACYSDLPSALVAVRSGGATGEPTVTAAALQAVAALLPGTGTGSLSGYVVLWAFVSLVCVAVLAVAVALDRADAPERALMLVLTPVLPLTLLLSADIVGVTFAVLALVAWRARHDVPAGVLLALAVMSRSYAVILVVVLVALALRTGRDLRRFLAGLAGGLVLVTGLAASRGLDVLTEPVRRWWEATPSYGSVWWLPQAAFGSFPTELTPWLAMVGWLVAVALVGWLAFRSPVAPQPADLALVGLATVLVTSPAVPVQASLWLVPLVALSSLPWRDMLVWAGAEALYFPMVWLYIGGLEQPNRGLPLGWYAVFTLLRLAAIAYLAAQASAAPTVPAGAGSGLRASGGSPDGGDAPRSRRERRAQSALVRARGGQRVP